jgi:Right handed beta helix region
MVSAVRVCVLFLMTVSGSSLLIADANAKTYYVDPAQSASKGNGSAESPWQNLSKILQNGAVKAGDEVVLKPGLYGELRLSGQKMSVPTKVISEIPGQAKFGSLYVTNSENWIFNGLSVSPIHLERPRKIRNLVEITANAGQIEISDFEIFSFAKEGPKEAKFWTENAISGIFARGPNITLSGNKLYNIDFGISVYGAGTKVLKNEIDGFSGDGLRGLGNDLLFEGNTVKNCHEVNGNHDDGFQSWTTGADGKPATGFLKNVILRRNMFIANETPDNSPVCNMQGIGMFGGIFENWVIENNIVVVNHWHGITVIGGRNVRIVNNTLIDPIAASPGPAWIKFANQKTRKSYNNVVANNLAPAFDLAKKGVLGISNMRIGDPDDLFVDPEAYDFRLKADSPAINAGMEGLGVTEDYYGTARPSGGRTDIGATEYQQ